MANTYSSYTSQDYLGDKTFSYFQDITWADSIYTNMEVGVDQDLTLQIFSNSTTYRVGILLINIPVYSTIVVPTVVIPTIRSKSTHGFDTTVIVDTKTITIDSLIRKGYYGDI